MTKKHLIGGLLALLFTANASVLAATDFWIPIYYADVGYNSEPVSKVVSTNHAHIVISGTNHNELATNFIVINGNTSAQMTYSTVINNSDRSAHSPAYFARYYDYNGSAILRANSGTTTANYTIWGAWNPNG